jgi:two-component system, cell cycle sensor histidine kinase and response regulator CckA
MTGEEPSVSHARSGRQSLRWRLTLSIFTLIAIVLAAFLWAAFREVEATLATAGGSRAHSAASQIAALLDRSAQQSIEELRRHASHPDVVHFVQAPSDASREAARARLSIRTGTNARRIEIWNAAGERLLELVLPSAQAAQKNLVLPPFTAPPPKMGLRELGSANDIVFSDAAAEISPSDAPDAALGYLLVRSPIVINPPGVLNQLVGHDARILVGATSGGAWTDFKTLVDPPPIDLAASGAREYRTAAGDARVGASAPIRGTPWIVWVEFDRGQVTAPARLFLRRMVATGIVVAIFAAVLVRILTRRVTMPLGELTRAAESIASGQYSQRVRVDRLDEVGRLGVAFNAMSAEIEDGRHRLEAQIADRTRALDALQSTEAERQRAVAAVVEGERAYRSTFDEAPVGIAHTHVDGHWLRVNRRFCDLLGYTHDELMSSDPATLVHPDEVAQDAATRATLLASTVERHLTVRRYRRKNGDYLSANLTLSLHRSEAGEPRYFIAIIEDLSERRALEEQLRQAQKMEAVGRLAGGVAHDFNNLLTAILGYANFVLEDLDESHPVLRDIEEIRKAGESAASLTRQLLAFSRRQVLQPQIVDLNAIVQKMDGLLHRIIGEDIQLSSHLAESLDPVNVDPGQVEQIVMNLAVNARDAMSRGGLLTIETSNVTLDESYVAKHPGATVGPHVMLAVSDNGPGMTPETMAQVFEPFFTTKPRGEGTGLGLATVYGIVKQSGGSIWVYSEIGRGSTFKVYFPRADGEQHRVSAPPPVALPKGGGETILVAEDQTEVRALARMILARHGYTVLEARSGVEALRLFREYPAPIHLLLTDVIMPNMSGRELVREVEKIHPGTRVLYASGYTDEAIERHGMLEPGLAFLQKPFTPRSLLQKVREVLDAAD